MAEMTTPVRAPTPPFAVPSLGATGEHDTRARVARLILENGPITAAGLGERLGLTPAAVRRHIDALLADGMIEAAARRIGPQAHRGRGRPAKWFVITDAGRSTFVQAYDDLATSALRFLAEKAGRQAVAEFARRQISDLERRYRPVVRAAPSEQRVRVLAEALSADGYAASASRAPGGAGSGPLAGGQQLCQQHCPVAHVAAEFPQLCEAETEAFGRLLDTPVQRLATIAHGDGVCTTHVTPRPGPAGVTAGDPATGAGADGDEPGRPYGPGAGSGTRQMDREHLNLDEESGRTPL